VRAFLHDLALAYEVRHGGGDGRAAPPRTPKAAAGD
jgi:hypothetical protein